MISARRRWAAGAVLVAVGALASPGVVPVYDGVATPDEPYRYVVPPSGAKKTPAATTATAETPMKGGVSTNGIAVATGEQGPQFSLFVPPGGLRATGDRLVITVTPQAPTDPPQSARPDGNVYRIAFSGGGPVTLTDAAAVSTLYLRSTNQRQPQPNMYYRPTDTAPWARLPTTAGGFDIRVSSFKGGGDYLVAYDPQTSSGSSGPPVLTLVLVGLVVLLVAVVLAVRVRAGRGTAEE